MRFSLCLSAAIIAIAACSAETSVSAQAPVDEARAESTGMDNALADNEWYQLGQKTLAANMAKKPIDTQAKNVILFIADGMDPTTVTAARIFDGQAKGMQGEENVLVFENLPHLAMSKTYNTNMQTPDSAGTATAMMAGIKTKIGVLNVSEAVTTGDCESGLANEVPSLGELAEQAGMAVGVISTARLTHATPATVYAHSASRNWEADGDLPKDAENCSDIARQLIEFPYGDGLEVALGGGRRAFLPQTIVDPENDKRKGRRRDGRDLTAEWEAKSDNHVYVWDKAGFDAAPDDSRLLGLFENSHMQYEADRPEDVAGEPSVAEMTSKAIDILSADQDGFFLMVEAGRVDHAHHGGNAYRALMDVQAFDAAVKAALDKTDPQDTLIVVTADHGHTMTIQGYPKRGNPILGVTVGTNRDGTPKDEPTDASDKHPYTTLVYANGPGSVLDIVREEGDPPRPLVTNEITLDKNYRQQALIPLGSETHGGQDVTIYASGPKAWLFDGTVEQNYIFHVIEHALDLNRRAAQADE